MRRRDFIQALPKAALLGAGALTFSGCAGIPHITPRGSTYQLVISVAQLPNTGVLLQRPGMERPVYLLQNDSGELTALLVRCTHRGCQPDPVGDRLVCPCHGSEFDLDGSVLEGPARRPLTRYLVTRRGDDIVISLGEEVR